MGYDMKAKKGKFRLPFLPGREYEGYYSDEPGDQFNGSPVPYLTYGSRDKLMHDIGCYAPELIDTEEGELLLFPIFGQQLQWKKTD
jgi:hypothetical protein